MSLESTTLKSLRSVKKTKAINCVDVDKNPMMIHKKGDVALKALSAQAYNL